ncbi:MAG: choice-of-anchor A family protein [Moraxellaceae bacterium]|nr:MAG: choice-of-anchor A family protein [Moraxellaceae bacterium]
MPIKHIKTMAALSVVAVSASVSATPLSDYNLILSDDFNVSGGSGHIEGKAFIGGNVVKGSVFAQHINKSSTENTVKVVGNFASNSAMHVEAGYVAYQGNFTGPTNICNGNSMGSSGCVKKITDGSLTTEKAAILTELNSEANYFKGLSASIGTSIFGDSNNKTFKYSGAATDLAVFTISATDLANLNWNVDFGSAVNLLINVTGNVFNAGNAHVNGFQNRANNVLWNFSDATNLNFGDSWYGSILALNATINTNSNLNGAIAAKSYIGNGEIHDYHWNYTPPKPPKPPVKVPEPSTLLLSLLGLGLVLLRHTRRK